MSAYLFIRKEKVRSWLTFGPSMLESPGDQRHGPLRQWGWHSVQLCFDFCVDQEMLMLCPSHVSSRLLLPTQVIGASVSLPQGSFIHSAVHLPTCSFCFSIRISFNKLLWTTYFLPGIVSAPEDREMENTQFWL